MGTAIVLKLSPNVLFWLVLINPTQVFKIAVVGHLQKSLETFGAAGLYASDVLGQGLVVLLSAMLCAWILVPLISAFLFFRTRCVD